MRRKLLAGLTGLILAATPITSSVAATEHDSARSCAQKFDLAQRMDMESFRDYDRTTFRAGHTSDAIGIFASGRIAYGIDAIMEALDGHFTNREGIWAWKELSRHVDHCKVAYIVYDATYDIPSIHYHQRTVTQVSYIYTHGKWLTYLDQGTYTEPPKTP